MFFFNLIGGNSSGKVPMKIFSNFKEEQLPNCQKAYKLLKIQSTAGSRKLQQRVFVEISNNVFFT